MRNCSPPALQEGLAAADAELLQRLDAIGRKSRRGDRNALDAAARIGRERRVGRGLQPFRAAEPRLKRDVDLAAKRFAQQPRGLLAVAMIGIAELERPPRHAVEAQQQPLGREIERGQLARQVGRAAPRCRADRHNKAAACAAPAARALRRAPRRRRRWRSPSSPRNIAGRAARRGCARSPPPPCCRSPRRCRDCRSASHNGR